MEGRRRAGLLLGVSGAGGLVGLAISTQLAAHGLEYASALGAPWTTALGLRVYPPWSVISWHALYGGAYPDAFELALLAGLGALLLPVGLAGALTGRNRAQPAPFGAQAWGGLADARRAQLLNGEKTTGRVLGRLEGRLLTFKGIEHCLIIGASRSGKGAGHVVPTLLNWDQSVFVYDRKGELWHITADHRRRISHTFYFAPSDPDTARWNPLFEVRKGPMEVADVQNIVGILVDPLGARQGQLDFFDQSAASFFVGLILHVLYAAEDQDKNMGFVRRLLIDIEPTLEAMMSVRHRWRPDPADPEGFARDETGAAIPETHPEVRLGAMALRSMEPRVRSSVLATAQKSLALWADPLVDAATSWSDFCVADLACAATPVSCYLITPQAHADRLAFLARVFLRQSFSSLMEHLDTDHRGRPKRHRMLMMLDEFPKLGALPFLESALGEMAGYGLSAHLICQSFNDIAKAYGARSSIFDNCHITAAFATSEPESIDRVIRRAGKSLEMRESFSEPRALLGKGPRTRSRSEAERYILGEQDVRGLAADRQFLFVNNARPFVTEKLRYYAEPGLAARSRNHFGGERAQWIQRRGQADVPPPPQIDWLGVRPVGEAQRPLQAPARETQPLAPSLLTVCDLSHDESWP